MTETDPQLEQRKTTARAWFEDLRDKICAAFEALEDKGGTQFEGEPGRFERKSWERPPEDGVEHGGGGVMSIMRGRVFEKVGVNVSTVQGVFSEKFAKEIPGADKDPRYWASGISLVAHQHSPKVPAVHMNTRFIVTGKTWFGGGGDLNPAFPNDRDTADFHNAFKQACDKYDPACFEKYKKWCDEYFFIKHRNKARGVGGIFYDYLNTGDWDADFAFTQDVGKAFLDIYPKLIDRHLDDTWSEEDREKLLVYRGHYAEYNLVYDRGTRFGLMTGGNTEAVLMSLPPEAKWP